MVLTATQVQAFFIGNDNMALPGQTFAQLAVEGITTPEDLIDFDKDSLKQVADNLRSPGGWIPNPDPNTPAGSTIARPPFVFGAKSQKRLLEACDIIRFYQTIGRNLTAGNIRYNPVIRNFAQQWKALKDRKENDETEVPKVTKALPIIKWSEAFVDYCNKKIGARTIPLAYVIRPAITPPAVASLLATDLPHSKIHGSVKADLINRASHNHPLYRDDNADVYFRLEEALRGTSFVASIKPFQRARNGRDAFFAVRNQYAGEDKWQAELKKQEDIVHSRIWKGQGQYTLDRYVAQHCNAFVMMQECSTHVPYQLPNEFTRVTHLFDNIQCNDASLQAAMALVRNDKDLTGKMNNFEDAASFIIPHDPVAKKQRATTKRDLANVAGTEAEGQKKPKSAASISSTSTKPSIGKTGVEFRFYKKPEYRKLSKEQKSELYQWQKSRKTNTSEKDPNSKVNGSASDIAAAVSKELEKRKEAEQDELETEKHFEKYIMSIIARSGKASAQVASAKSNDKSKTPKVTINSILKRAKRNT